MNRHEDNAGDNNSDAASDTDVREWAFGGFTFELSQGLRRDGAFIALGPKAQLLLNQLLLAAPGSVTREALIRSVWRREPRHLSRNVLSNAVAALRKALQDDKGQLVETRPDLGYRLACPVQGLSKDGAGSANLARPLTPGEQADKIIADLVAKQVKGVLGRSAEASSYSVVRDAVLRMDDQPAPVLAALQERLASLCTRRLDYRGASHHYRHALDLHRQAAPGPTTDSLRTQFRLASTLAGLTRSEPGTGPLEQARRLLDEGFALLATWPEDDPNTHCLAWYVATAVYLFAEDQSASRLAAIEALQWAPRARGLDPRHIWDIRANCAVALFSCNRQPEGLEVLQALLADPNSGVGPDDILRSSARLHLGAFRAQLGDFEEAAELLQPLVTAVRDGSETISPLTVAACAELGACLRELGQLDEAIALLRLAHRRALGRFEPSSEESLEIVVALALALHRQGDKAQAQRMLGDALKPRLPELRAPGQRYATAALAHYMDMLIEAGRIPAARKLMPVLERCNLWTVVRDEALAQRWLARLRSACAAPAQRPRVR